MSLDSEVYFAQRSRFVGISDSTFNKISTKGWRAMGSFAFSCHHSAPWRPRRCRMEKLWSFAPTATLQLQPPCVSNGLSLNVRMHMQPLCSYSRLAVTTHFIFFDLTVVFHAICLITLHLVSNVLLDLMVLRAHVALRTHLQLQPVGPKKTCWAQCVTRFGTEGIH